ncbi:MAG TPA: AsmA-like C-terminal region-containing protein [Perlabentimonas sp.]|nr:AsmA-like C-terminal region-containing protein [Perlabentimonas sp.]
MRLVFKIILFLLSFVLAFTISLGIAGYLLQDQITASTLEFINKNLKSHISVKAIDVSLLKGFPYASVSLTDVEIFEGSIESAAEFEPGLLSIDNVTIKVNFKGLLKNDFNIKKCIISDGWINLYFDNKGKGNFEIFEKNENTKSSWLFNLDAFVLQNINLSYIDLHTGWIFKGLIENAKLSGEISSDKLLLDTKIRTSVGILRQGTFHYVQNQKMSLNTTFMINETDIQVWPSQGVLGKISLNVSGNIGRTLGSQVSLSVKSDNFDVEQLIGFLSQHHVKLPPNTKTQGDFAFNLSVDGFAKTEKPYLINLNFYTIGLNMQLPNKPALKFNKMVGTFNNGKLGTPETSEVNISELNLSSGLSNVSGIIRVKNLTSPLYHVQVNQNVNLPDIAEWGATIPVEKGAVSGSFEALGLLNSIENINLESFENSKFYGHLQLADIDFEQVGYVPDLKKVSGSVSINNQDISNANINGLFFGSFFEARFNAKQASAILFGKEKTAINADITLDSLNTKWLNFTSANTQLEPDKEATWDRVESLSANVFIDNFVHHRFRAVPLSANILIEGKNLYCKSLLARACGGLITGKLELTANPQNQKDLTADLDAENIDISNLFYSFKNFKQDVITSKHIMGELEGSLVFSAPIVSQKVVTENVEANGNIKILNGRLVDVEQLNSLSKFIAVEELEDIKFSTLENSFSISNGMLTIPEMDIKSSALNLKAMGTHGFNGNYEYLTQLYLSDVIFRKASQKKREVLEFGEVDDDGSGRAKLYLKIEGNKNDLNVSYDRTSAREALKQNLRNEGKVIRDILRDEFSFKKNKPDSAKKDSVTKKPKFTIEWE